MSHPATSIRNQAQLTSERALASLPEGEITEASRAAFAAGADGLLRVESTIREKLASEASVLTDISEYLLSLGGKRIRPLLTILAGRLFGAHPAPDTLIRTAAGIEMIHMATLLHDDIIDQSPTRRNNTSAFLKFGSAPTLLAGDFLLVKAFGICAKLDSFVIEATERACIELTEGEVEEGVIETGAEGTGTERYFWVIRRKTASLFALAATIGAHFAGASVAARDDMREFGYCAGCAFQMIDDILDIVADEDLLGKPAGTDLRQKTPSLVNVLWLASGDPRATAFFDKEKPNEGECKEAMQIICSSQVLSEARELAAEYAARASDLLDALPDPNIDEQIRTSLKALLEYTLRRCL